MRRYRPYLFIGLGAGAGVIAGGITGGLLQLADGTWLAAIGAGIGALLGSVTGWRVAGGPKPSDE